MEKVILIASGKGGVGKTTFCASLGLAMGRMGHRVLLIDGDMGLRDLDLALGVQDEVMFTSRDLWKKSCFMEDAVLSITTNVDFLPASQSYRWEDIKEKSFTKLVKQLKKHYDYILIDGPAGIGVGIEALLPKINQLLLVVEPNWMSIRDAQKVMALLRERRFHEYGVVINKMPFLERDQILSPQDMQYHLGVDTMTTILPWSVTLARLVHDGRLRDMEGTDPYWQLLIPACSWITGDEGDDILSVFDRVRSSHEEETQVPKERISTVAKVMRRGWQWKWRTRGR